MGKFVLNVNGASVSVDAAPDESLLYVLRDRLQLTGTKYGCGEGQCGACTVLLDGRATRSCLTPVVAATGAKIVTIEGLEHGGRDNRRQARPRRAPIQQHRACSRTGPRRSYFHVPRSVAAVAQNIEE